MSAPMPQTALQLAEWQGMAKVQGVSLARVACAALRERMKAGKAEYSAGEVWADMNAGHRAIALTWLTDRKTVDGVRWDQLTDAEKTTIGAFLRGWAKTAKQAEFLR
jgi:hypothetical protein